MSDSINEQRCPHGKIEPHRYWQFDRPVRCPGPSVVTPPAQDEQRWNYCGHESTHAPHLNCCGYQVEFPFPAAPSVSTDIDEQWEYGYLSEHGWIGEPRGEHYALHKRLVRRDPPVLVADPARLAEPLTVTIGKASRG